MRGILLFCQAALLDLNGSLEVFRAGPVFSPGAGILKAGSSFDRVNSKGRATPPGKELSDQCFPAPVEKQPDTGIFSYDFNMLKDPRCPR